jgi:hypothetical protein
MLWQASSEPQRPMPSGKASAPIFGRPFDLTQEHWNLGRWRD